MKKLKLCLIILLTLIIVPMITYVVLGLELTDVESIGSTILIGDIPQGEKKEHTYTMPLKWILRDGERKGNSIRYISQEQLTEISDYIETALNCHGPKGRWWKCGGDHSKAWDLFVQYGIFTYDDYYTYRYDQDGFQAEKLSTLKATDVFDLEKKGECTISTLMSYLNNTSSSPLRVLREFQAIYCLKHHKAVPSYHAYLGEGMDDDQLEDYSVSGEFAKGSGSGSWDVSEYITATYNVNSRLLEGDSVSISKYGIWGYLDDSEDVSKTQTLNSNIKYYLTNEETEDLHTVKTGFGSYTTNVFNYSLTFSQKYMSQYLDGKYGQERCQNSIWGTVGDGAITSEGTALNIAGKSVDSLDTQIQTHGTDVVVSKVNGSASKVSSGVGVGDSKYEPTGTTITKNENGETVYQIGPFKMSDYAYVACSYAINYSGSQVSVDKDIVGGIVYGEIVLDNGITIPIGSNERVEGSDKQFVSNSSSTEHAKVIYKNTSDKGDCNRHEGESFQTPADYKYPWPNSTFYIEVPASLCGDAEYLEEMNFEYRTTRTEGNGWIITGKYVKTTWEVDNETTGCKTYDATESGECGDTHSTTITDIYSEYPVTVEWDHTYTVTVGSPPNEHDEERDCEGSASGECSSHGFKKCVKFNWKLTGGPTVELAQPFLAAHDAHTYVELTYNPNENLHVRLTTNVTIDKYISKIDHVGENINTFNGGTSRQNETNITKLANFLKAERGDKITYSIVLKNQSDIEVKVQVKDELPEYCILQSVKTGDSALTIYTFNDSIPENDVGNKYSRWFITNWVTVPANGEATITVEIIATAKNSAIMSVNKATLVSGNKGRDIGSDGVTKDDNSVNYVRMTGDLDSSAVVNLAQIEGDELYKVLTSSDYYDIKEYNVSIEKYIYDVSHNRGNGVSNTLDTTTLSETDSRSIQNGMSEDTKQANPVYVEYGDTVTYKIKIYNTTNDYANFNDRENSPYWEPDKVYVNIEDTLPKKYSNLKMTIESSDGSYSKIENVASSNTQSGGALYQKYTATTSSSNGGKFSLTNVMVPSNGVTTITITLTVDEYTKGTIETNTVKFTGKMRNINYGRDWSQTNDNRCVIQNNSTNTSTKDYYILNNYNAFIDKFAYQYNESILDENNSDEFDFTEESKLTGSAKTVFNSGDKNVLNNLRMNTSSSYNTYSETYVNAPSNLNKLTDKIRNANGKDAEKKNVPLSVDKEEEVVYAIKVSNEASTVTNTQTNTGNKPATQVRISQVTDHMQYGLELQSVKAIIYKSDGSTKKTLTGIKSSSTNVNSGKVNYYCSSENVTEEGRNYKYREWIYNVGQDTLLDPGEYIIYYVTVKVTESDMFLYDLENTAELTKLTNINNQTYKTREVKNKNHNENISSQQKSKEYIRMKDLVIAGKVWLDFNKNGLMDDTITDYVNQTDSESLYRQQPSKLSEYYSINENAMMKNITVKLYDSSGKLLRTTVTDDEGKFSFARYISSDSSDYTQLKLYTTQYYNYDSSKQYSSSTTYQRIDKATSKDGYGNYTSSSQYISYYIEYEYDGVVYKSTAYSGKDHLNDDGSYKGSNTECHSFETNTSQYSTNTYTKESSPSEKYKYEYDSNANEIASVREAFNTQYEYITYNQAYTTSDTTATGSELEFDKATYSDGTSHTSQLLVDNSRKMTARSFLSDLTQPAKTETTEYIPLYKYNSSNVTIPYSRYLKFINLGLELREDVDISLTKDVYKVKTTIKGEEMEYNFNENNIINGDQLSDTLKDNYMKDEPYGIELYESDYKFRNEQYSSTQAVQEYFGQEAELNVEVTYRIRIDNNQVGMDDDLKETNELSGSYNDKNFDDTDETKLYVKVDEILDLYDENFIEYTGDPTKDYIEVRQEDAATGRYSSTNKKINVAEAWYYKENTSGNGDYVLVDSIYIKKSEASEEDLKNNSTTYDKVDLKVSNNTIEENTKGSTNPYINGENYKKDGYHKLYVSGMGNEKIEEGSHLDIFVKYVLDKGNEEVTNTNVLYEETASKASSSIYGGITYDEATGKLAYSWGSSSSNSSEWTTSMARSLIIKEHTTTDFKKQYGLGTENIAQINYYSVWYSSSDKPASLVDKDSNAGNVGMSDSQKTTVDKSVDSADNKAIYEDTVYKTGIDITAKGTANYSDDTSTGSSNSGEIPITPDIRRFITGQVWDDSRSETIAETTEDGTQKNIQYVGNGLRNSGSKIAEAKANELVPIVIDGKTEETDISVPSAKAEFIEIVEIAENVYYEVTPTDVTCDYQQHVRTAEDGTYELYGFTPGKYVVRFTYGDNIDQNVAEGITETTTKNSDNTVQASQEDMYLFNGQDYKSTTYTTPDLENGGVLDDNITLYAGSDEEKNIDKIIASLEAETYNDARDDEIRRLEVNSYSETMDNQIAEILQGMANGTIKKDKDGNYVTDEDGNYVYVTNNVHSNSQEQEELHELELDALVDNTWMMAETIPFTVRTEKIDDGLKSKIKSVVNDPTYASREQLETDLVYQRTFSIENVDFGIEYRPENSVQLEKDIKEVKITTESNETVVDLFFNTEYEKITENTKDDETVKTHILDQDKSIGLDMIQFISNEYTVNDLVSKLISESSYEEQGFVYINYDTDIQQGATVEITYSFIAENHGEVDRISKNLDAIRYQNNPATQALDESVIESNDLTKELNENGDTTYKANITAANDMINRLYEYDNNNNIYRTSPKVLTTTDGNRDNETYSTSTTDVSKYKLSYYGYYNGYSYYTGDTSSTFDTVAEIKFNKIIDYVDKDMEYENDTTGKDVIDSSWTPLDNTYSEYYTIIDWARSNTNYIASVANKNLSEIKDSKGNTIGATKVTSDEVTTYLKNKLKELTVYSAYDVMTDSTELSGELYHDLTVENITGASIDPDGYIYDNMLITSDTSIYTDIYTAIGSTETVYERDGAVTGTNSNLSRFLLPEVANDGNDTNSQGKIDLTVSKAISAETGDDELEYENIAEIVEFTTLTGRRTNFAITIGNVDVRQRSSTTTTTPGGNTTNTPTNTTNTTPTDPTDPTSNPTNPTDPNEYPQAVVEPDQSAAEVVTLIPPQGLTRTDRVIRDVVEVAKTGSQIVIIMAAVIGMIVFVTMFGIRKYRKRRIK